MTSHRSVWKRKEKRRRRSWNGGAAKEKHIFFAKTRKSTSRRRSLHARWWWEFPALKTFNLLMRFINRQHPRHGQRWKLRRSPWREAEREREGEGQGQGSSSFLFVIKLKIMRPFLYTWKMRSLPSREIPPEEAREPLCHLPLQWLAGILFR